MPDNHFNYGVNLKVGAVRFFQDNLWHVSNPKARQYADYLCIATEYWDGQTWNPLVPEVVQELQGA